MTTADISPDILAQVRESAEPVIVRTKAGYQRGVRSTGPLFMMYNCLGSLTITQDGEVLHSFLSGAAGTVFTPAELAASIEADEQALATKRAALETLA